MKTIAQIIMVIAFAGIFAFVLNIGLDKTEIVDCHKKAKQAHDAPELYRAWQAENATTSAIDDATCNAHGIEIITQ